ncbi:hypothetical protein GH5_06278 [Leishmania sp. Ghana 2012 LV757]|uniref:hypothetical protein n=1 Tax=Leishmania sp. Ghana 2012 LV757 TaxID=2803181 RepID=UPI001B4C3D25|nr:hypothetical protein GH5_06278 [Leishmania sp. Ghana 2012 LV757]
MATAAHRAAAVGGCVEASTTRDSTAAGNSATFALSGELDQATQRRGVAVESLSSDAFCSSPTVAQGPLHRVGDGVESVKCSVSTSAPLLATTDTIVATERGSAHTHPHLLHIIQQQQERIATLQASLAHTAKSAQRSSEALESLWCNPRVSARTGRARAVGVPSSPVGRVSPPLASVAEVTSAVAATVRWADRVDATLMLPSPVSRDGFTECKDDLPALKRCSFSPSSSSTAPATCAPLPVILLDITSMFTMRPTRAVAVHPSLQQSLLSTHRRSSHTQTEWVAAESAALSDRGTGGSADVKEQLAVQLRSELAKAQRRLQEAETLIMSLRASVLALQHQHSAPSTSPAPADAVSFPNGATGDSCRLSSDIDRARCGGAAEDRMYSVARKDMEELQRLRVLLRFSELKKDSDRLASVENALRESSAARLHLRKRCECLEHEKAQRGSCLRAVVCCVETTLATLKNGAFGNRRDDITAAAAATVALPDKLVAVLKHVLRLCADSAPSPGAQKAPLPMQRPSPPQARQSFVRLHQDRLHKAASDSRDGGGPLPHRPPSQRPSWRGSGAAAAAALGERRVRKQ